MNEQNLNKSIDPIFPSSTEDVSSKRIDSIDFVKGFAIVFIILAHVSVSWFSSEWSFLFGIVFLFLDILGPSLFIFLSALSVIFSIRRKRGRMPEKLIRNRILLRGVMFGLIGLLGNIPYALNSVEYPFPLGLWGWDFIMFIGFSQVICYYVIRLSKISRILISIIIILASTMVREWLFLNRYTHFVFWLLNYMINSPNTMVPFLPWVSICFLSSIFGEYLYNAMVKGTKQSYDHLFKILLGWGIIFLIVGIITGLYLVDDSNLVFKILYPQVALLSDFINQQPFMIWTGVPIFLIRSTFSNMWYNLGAALTIIAIFFYFIDIKKKKNVFVKMIIFYGNISLSLYLFHFVFITLYVGQFPIYYFPFICLCYIGFLGFLFYFWNKLANGIFTPEWIMIQMGKIGQQNRNQEKK
ncbi:MAG: heparan-alpha-glucosaminide N-acetyltransferase domain-containing protein [Promethearchaeota archaeon]